MDYISRKNAHGTIYKRFAGRFEPNRASKHRNSYGNGQPTLLSLFVRKFVFAYLRPIGPCHCRPPRCSRLLLSSVIPSNILSTRSFIWRGLRRSCAGHTNATSAAGPCTYYAFSFVQYRYDRSRLNTSAIYCEARERNAKRARVISCAQRVLTRLLSPSPAFRSCSTDTRPRKRRRRLFPRREETITTSAFGSNSRKTIRPTIRPIISCTVLSTVVLDRRVCFA